MKLVFWISKIKSLVILYTRKKILNFKHLWQNKRKQKDFTVTRSGEESVRELEFTNLSWSLQRWAGVYKANAAKCRTPQLILFLLMGWSILTQHKFREKGFILTGKPRGNTATMTWKPASQSGSREDTRNGAGCKLWSPLQGMKVLQRGFTF